MNERIEKLAKQSGLWFVTEREDLCKDFAELIIRECAMICDDIGKEARKEWKTKYIPHDDGRSDGAWQCEEAILDHFGVES